MAEHRTIPPRELGVLLRGARHRLGIGQKALARMVGTSFGYVSNLELGLRSPSTDMAGRLIEALQLGAGDAAMVRAAAVSARGRTRR